MKRSFGKYFLDSEISSEISEETTQRIKYKQNSEKPIPLIYKFTSKAKNALNTRNFDIQIPTPFIKLWDKIDESFDEYSNKKDPLYYTSDKTITTGIFWRLYAVYKHGADFNLELERIKQSPPSVQDFWNEQLPILSKAIRPYVIVNRYVIMPLNRTINRIKGLL